MTRIFITALLTLTSACAFATTRTAIMKQEEAQTERSVQLRSSDPGSPVANQLWVNTTSDLLKYYNGSTTKSVGSNVVHEIVYVKDIKAANTQGGTCTTGSFATRTLNTLENPSSYAWVSLGSNQVTLSAGTYEIDATSYGEYFTGNIKAKLRNTTDSTDVIIGTNGRGGFSAVNDTSSAGSSIRGVFTIAGSKVFEFQERCETTAGGADGLGFRANFGVSEVYLVAKITKIAN